MTSAPGVIVTVYDDASGAPICDANVEVAVNAITYRETLTPMPPVQPGGPGEGGTCTYVGVHDKNGLYQVTGSRSGYAEVSQTLWVSSDACHVQTQRVILRLKKE